MGGGAGWGAEGGIGRGDYFLILVPFLPITVVSGSILTDLVPNRKYTFFLSELFYLSSGGFEVDTLPQMFPAPLSQGLCPYVCVCLCVCLCVHF